jgi:hypothetical protein
MPPKIKVLEAAGAIADGRITFTDERNAVVVSSDGSRRYSVYVDLTRKEACSTDNGTVHRGYVGYPIIAVLMLKGALPYDSRIGDALKGVPWKALNERYKKYAIVENEVKKIVAERGVLPEELERFKNSVYKELRRFKLKLADICLSKE